MSCFAFLNNLALIRRVHPKSLSLFHCVSAVLWLSKNMTYAGQSHSGYLLDCPTNKTKRNKINKSMKINKTAVKIIKYQKS